MCGDSAAAAAGAAESALERGQVHGDRLGGTCTCRLAPRDGSAVTLCVAVTDSGPGIPGRPSPPIVPAVYAGGFVDDPPLWRHRPRTDDQPQPDPHDGRRHRWSTAVSVSGSTFSFEITLPVAAPVVATRCGGRMPRRSCAAAHADGGGQSNQSTGAAPDDHAAWPHAAASSTTARKPSQAAREEDYDVVVLDLQMPGVGRTRRRLKASVSRSIDPG